METRFLSQNDFFAVNRIVRQVHNLHVENRPDVYRDTDPFPKEEFDRLLTEENVFALVAEEAGQIAGFCAMTIKAPPDNPLLQPRIVALIDDICVDETYRKKGVGRLLFDAASQAARQRGAVSLELGVWAFNETARHFYEDMGMTERSRVMELKL